MAVRLLPALAAALVLTLPATAHAATLTNSGGALKFTAAAGVPNVVALSETTPGIVSVTRSVLFGDGDPITSVSGCNTVVAGTAYLCVGVTSVTVDAGNGNDVIDAGGNVLSTVGLKTIPSLLIGGDGHDELYGGAQSNTIRGGPDDDTIYGGGGNDVLSGDDGDDTIDGGAGNDTLDGGAGNDELDGDDGADLMTGDDGNDVLDGGAGADTYSGGAGFDRAIVASTLATPPLLGVSLDDLTNDGVNGVANVLSDIEEVDGSARSLALLPGTVTLVGNAGPNVLDVLAGHGRISGGPGSDVLNGGPEDDIIDARDGEPDTVTCGGGRDEVIADTVDTVAADCETVVLPGATGAVLDSDHPPTVAWVSPAASASLSPNRAITLRADAADDRAVVKVGYFLGDRVVCEATAAPWSCAFRATPGEIGSATLTAMAYDGAGQTSSTLRTVTIRRFTPRVTLKYAKGVASGKLKLPGAVGSKTGCKSGSVSLVVRSGKRILRTRKIGLRKNCGFRARVSPAHGAKLKARFGGNATLATASSPARAA